MTADPSADPPAALPPDRTEVRQEPAPEREAAAYRRRSMEQRRNIEITIFGALVTAQITLVALVASNAGKPASHVVSRFAGIVGVTLFATYVAIIIAIEVRNRADRHAYARWEVNRATEESLWESFRRSWAAWPAVGAAVITAALVWATVAVH
jgi:hypothetical protein